MRRLKKMTALSLTMVMCITGICLEPLNAKADSGEEIVLDTMEEELVERPTFDGVEASRDADSGIAVMTVDEGDSGSTVAVEEDYRDWVQSDPRWGSLTLGASKYTVANSGCLITSIAKLIVQCGLKSPDQYTPANLITWMNENGGFTSDGSMIWARVENAVSGFKFIGRLQPDGLYSTKEYNDQIVKWIKAGNHIVVNVKSRSHWVAIDEARTLATGQVYLMDTVDGWVNTGITLESRYPTFNRIYSYTGGTTPPADDGEGNGSDNGSNLPVMSYTDVEETAWYYSAVKYVYEKELMVGTSDSEFSPLKNLSRSQFAAILHRMSGSPEMEYQAVFPDVPDGVWYTDAALWANEEKIVYGYDTGLFGANDDITREQMASIMYRYAGFMGYDTSASADLSHFDDVESVSDYAKEGMQWAVGEGIISGKNGVSLDPQGLATRAECASIIMRFVERYSK